MGDKERNAAEWWSINGPHLRSEIMYAMLDAMKAIEDDKLKAQKQNSARWLWRILRRNK